MPVRERRPRNQVPDTADPLDKVPVLAPRAPVGVVARPAARGSRYCTAVPANDRPNAEQCAAFAHDGYLVVPGVVERRAIEAALQVANQWLDDGFDSTRRDTYHSQSSRLNTSQTRRSSASSPRPTGSRSPSHSSASRSSRHRAVRSPSDSRWHVANRPTLSAHTSTASPHHSTACQPTARSTTSRFSPASFFPTVLPATTATSPCGQAHTSTARWLRAHGTSVSDPDAFFATIRKLARDVTAAATGGSRRRPPARALSAPAQLWATPRTQHSLRRVLSTSDPASR